MSKKSQKKYWAFISYSSKDEKWGQWLRKRLEGYPLPKALRGTKLSDGTELPKHLRPVFRDRDELTGSSDLGPALRDALTDSRYLIVLCSPHSAQSKWVNEEILEFQKQGRGQQILALIIEGEPNSQDPKTECFPPALRAPAEPLAGDLRKSADGKERGFLKILAGVSELSFDELYQRHERAQRQRLLILGFLASTIIISLSALSLFAFQQKGVADTERSRALENEVQAVKERDNARKTLTKLYFDRALKAQNPNESLAWMLRSSESDPECLQQPEIAPRILNWFGPWPCPDKAIHTGIADDKLRSNKPVIAHRFQRILFKEGPESWKLMHWQQQEPIATGVIDDYGTLNLILDSENSDWFAILGQKKIEIRRWEDGALIHTEVSPGLSASMITIGKSLIISSNPYRMKDGTKLFELREEDGKFTRYEISQIKGEINNLQRFQSEESLTLAFIQHQKNQDDKQVSHLKILRCPELNAPWSEVEYQLPEEIKLPWLKNDDSLPKHLVFLNDGSNSSDYILNLKKISITKLSTNYSKILGAREMNSEWELVHNYYNRTSRSYEFKTQPSHSETLTKFLSDHRLSRVSKPGRDSSIVGWDEEKQKLTIIKTEQAPYEISLPRNLNLVSLGVSEIHSLENDHALLEIGGTHSALMLVDYRDRQSIQIWIIGTTGFQELITIETIGNAKKAIFLSHNNRSITHTHLVSYSDWILKQNGYLEKLEGPIIWSKQLADGKLQTLSQHPENKKNYRFSESGHAAQPWFALDTSSLNQDDLTTLQSGAIVVKSYAGLTLLSINQPKPLHLGRNAIVLKHPDRELILAAENQSLNFINPETREVISSVEIDGQIKQLAQNKKTQEALALIEKTSGLYGQDVPKLELQLLTLDSAKGILREQKIEWTGEQLRNRNYSDRSEIFAGSTSSFVKKTNQGTQGHHYEFYETKADSFSKRIEWTHHGSSRIQSWWPLSKKSLIALTSTSKDHDRNLTYFEKENNEWHETKLRLPSPFEEIYPSPKGDLVAIICESHALLYDFYQKKLTPLNLKITSNSYIRENLTNSKSEWLDSGESFFLWGSQIHQFNRDGQHLQEIPGHQNLKNLRSGLDYTFLSTTNNGSHLIIGDSLGNVSTRLINYSAPKIDELHRRATLQGGLIIKGDDKLTKWPASN